MSKPTDAVRGTSGVREKTVDLQAVYGANADPADATVIFPTPNDLAVLDNTTAVLGANGVYVTGPNSPVPGIGKGQAFVRVNGYSRVVGTVFADAAGSLNIDWSSDGQNVDYTDTVAVSASTKTKFSLEVVAPYASVRYVNGAGAQTAIFRLYAWLRRMGAA